MLFYDISELNIFVKLLIVAIVLAVYYVLKHFIRKTKEGTLKIYLKIFLIVYVNFFALMAFWLFGNFWIFLILVLLLLF